MPFTFSHPAAILFLAKVSKSKLSLTGLIVGSLAPDFEYFIFMKMQRTHGHEITSFLWFNLPICLLLAFLYHGIVKTPLTNSLPHFLYQKIAIYQPINWFVYFKKYWIVFIYSAAAGTFSHLLWDSFTHEHGLFGKSPLFLSATVLNTELRWFELLQSISTVLGGFVVFYFIAKMPSTQHEEQPLILKFMYWFNVLCMICFIFIIKAPATGSDFIAVSIGSTLYAIIGSSIYYLIYEKVYSYRNHQL